MSLTGDDHPQETRFRNDSDCGALDASNAAEVPIVTTKLQRLKRHKRRTGEILRGRIFGFIPVWSSKCLLFSFALFVFSVAIPTPLLL